MGRKGGEGGKLTTMMSKDGKHICEPAEVREMAAKHGEKTLAAGEAAPDVVGEILREILPVREEGGDIEKGEGLEAALEWQNFQFALRKCKARKGVGITASTRIYCSRHLSYRRGTGGRSNAACLRRYSQVHGSSGWR
jgi:hypothetical protein